MHEPGEQEWHGYILRFDNPVEWAVKEGSFFSLNNAIVVLNRLVGRLEYYKTHPDQFLPAHGKPSIEPALLIDKARLSEVRALKVAGYDLTRLVCLCEELDYCYQVGAYHAVIMLTRAILDHVPPLFGCKNFAEVANNYAGTKSFKQSMDHLQGGARNIADLHLHGQVRAVESLPNATQVNFSQYLDPIRFS
jgi:hypothetical protein